MIRLLTRRTEQHMQGVADDLGDRAIMAEHDVRHAKKIVVQERREFLGSSVSASAVKLAMSVNRVATCGAVREIDHVGPADQLLGRRLGEK